MADYYYDKYKLIEEWDKDSSNHVDSETITTDEVTKEEIERYTDDWYITAEVYTDYEIRSKNAHGYKDHYLKLTDPVSLIHVDPLHYIGMYIYDYGGRGYFLYGWLNSRNSWDVTHRIYLGETYKIYKHQYQGSLLAEDVIKDHRYPRNGPKDGYWWVRKGPYTIPAPAIISPDNAYEINKKDGDEMPYLVFQLTPRENNDRNLYHVRVRMGFRSDFADYELYLESKEDTSGWEYYNGSSWQSFPSSGVSANTRVRIKPAVDNFEFGFHYWDCTAYNSRWGYGVSSEYRMIIVLDETEGIYVVSINGIQYNPISLKISESSNGETSSIDIVLSNHNV
ncbi:hypothetical protein [Halocella sp. SP3-1]|uniref:hypothetical protein n=1 Tax=Halocella sp. SP3-1 TaxID=2382161 RepID=UPI000F759A44|nr:hypothetical protein [Halocella sp. SP3-1]AZO95286.1 hypothetical protein D7D81_12165 [Halocella sp. SP3-1]